MKNKKYYGKSDILLAWDYAADPTWLKGSNVPISEIVKDKNKIKEIEKWYSEFSSAEELLHPHESLPMKITDEQLEKIIKDLKERLVPRGQKLAKDIGAKFHIDWGHDERVLKIVHKVVGKDIN